VVVAVIVNLSVLKYLSSVPFGTGRTGKHLQELRTRVFANFEGSQTSDVEALRQFMALRPGELPFFIGTS